MAKYAEWFLLTSSFTPSNTHTQWSQALTNLWSPVTGTLWSPRRRTHLSLINRCCGQVWVLCCQVSRGRGSVCMCGGLRTGWVRYTLLQPASERNKIKEENYETKNGNANHKDSKTVVCAILNKYHLSIVQVNCLNKKIEIELWNKQTNNTN